MSRFFDYNIKVRYLKNKEEIQNVMLGYLPNDINVVCRYVDKNSFIPHIIFYLKDKQTGINLYYAASVEYREIQSKSHFDLKEVFFKIKRLFHFYKYFPLYLYYRVTDKGWVPQKDYYIQDGLDLYTRFVYHYELKKGLPAYFVNNNNIDEKLSLYIGDFEPENVLSEKDMSLAKKYNLVDEEEK